MIGHEWTDADGVRWKATDYGCFVYMDGDKWTTPLESASVATVEMNRLAEELKRITAPDGYTEGAEPSRIPLAGSRAAHLLYHALSLYGTGFAVHRHDHDGVAVIQRGQQIESISYDACLSGTSREFAARIKDIARKFGFEVEE